MTTQTSETFTVRELGGDPADLDTLYDGIVGHEVAELGQTEFTRPFIDQLPTFRIWHAWAAEAPGRRPAIGQLMRYPGGAHLHGELFVADDYPPEVARALVDALVERSGVVDDDTDFHVSTCDHDIHGRAALEARRGRLNRQFFRMLVATPTVPAAPVVPDGVDVRTCDGTDEDMLRVKHIRDEAFSEHFGAEVGPDDDWLEFQRRTEPDVSLWWLARVDGEPAAALRAKLNGTFGWVDNLGTLAPHRGRGLGRLLLQVAFHELASRGATEVGLGVDAGNVTPALHLYESVGMHRSHVWVTYDVPKPA